ncbi:MAG: hypothetical protein KF752_08085 [Pirellulaceae bacterium]|nr:hypothetical protein [Pirellulaceae bacterium]
MAERSREREAERRATEQALLDHATERLRDELDAELSSVVQECKSAGRLSKVPSCDAPTATLPAERVEKFKQHLRQVLEQAQAMLSQPRYVQAVLVEYAHRQGQSDMVPLLPVINGCTTCRGYCCRNGADTAFLSAEYIAWQMLCDPTATIEAIEKWYLLQLPDESIEDSCVYHSQQGCSLPRQQRASICNDFHCWGLQDALAKHRQDEVHPWTSIAYIDQSAVRVGIVTPAGDRIERDIPNRSVESHEVAPS